MTRRERLAAKLEKREEWAEKAAARSDAAFGAASRLADSIPLGQPILVGHHSEGRARRDADRIASGMRRGIDAADLAKDHAAKAAGIERMLGKTIFSDDPDAVGAIGARVADLEAKRARLKALGAAWKKAGKPRADDDGGWAKVAAVLGVGVGTLVAARRDCAIEDGFLKRGPAPGYSLTNLSANIRRLKARVGDVEARAARSAEAEAAGGVAIAGDGEYVRVTFAEKPDREILDALRAAGFWWSGGSWGGRRDRLPAEVADLASPPTAGDETAVAGPPGAEPVTEVDPAEWPCPDGPDCADPVCIDAKAGTHPARNESGPSDPSGHPSGD